MLKKLSKKLLFKLTQKGGYFFVKSGGQLIKVLFNTFKIKSDLSNNEKVSFESQVKKYKLSSEDLIKKESMFVRHSIIYLILGVLIFFYGCYFLSQSQLYSCSLCWSLSLLLFSLAFRAHFWFYQIKTRQLGANIKDWTMFVLKGEDGTKNIL